MASPAKDKLNIFQFWTQKWKITWEKKLWEVTSGRSNLSNIYSSSNVPLKYMTVCDRPVVAYIKLHKVMTNLLLFPFSKHCTVCLGFWTWCFLGINTSWLCSGLKVCVHTQVKYALVPTSSGSCISSYSVAGGSFQFMCCRHRCLVQMLLLLSSSLFLLDFHTVWP